MGTYTKNGYRKFKVETRKSALKDLDNFQYILNNLNALDKEINNYDGVITKEKLSEIANLINLEKKLKLTEAQVKMVTKKYE